MVEILLTHETAALDLYYGAEALAGLQALGDVRLNETGEPLGTDALIDAAADCAIIVSDRNTPGEAALFDAAQDLVGFLRCAVDVRNIDIEAASRNGVLVTNASPGFVDAVAELVIGMMVDLARGISRHAATYHSGKTPTGAMGRQLSGSTLGIVGYGQIGARVAALGKALGMQVLACDPYKHVDDPEIRQMDMKALLSASDFVVPLAVATAKTENLIGEAAFAAMKRGAFLINVSRGNLVDEAALDKALRAGSLAGAALDVGRAPDQMPTPGLAALPNVIATPHIGGLTPTAIQAQALETVAQVRALVSGVMPHNALNPERADRLACLGIER